MKSFYLASSLTNKEAVQTVSRQLIENDFHHTYDWTKNGPAASYDQLRMVGQLEKEAVLAADFVVVLLPGGKGTHIEFGLALAQGKRIYLYSADEGVFSLETTSTFYHLPEVTIVIGSLEDLVGRVVEEERS